MLKTGHIGSALLFSTLPAILLSVFLNPIWGIYFTCICLSTSHIPDIDTSLPIPHQGVTHTIWFIAVISTMVSVLAFLFGPRFLTTGAQFIEPLIGKSQEFVLGSPDPMTVGLLAIVDQRVGDRTLRLEDERRHLFGVVTDPFELATDVVVLEQFAAAARELLDLVEVGQRPAEVAGDHRKELVGLGVAVDDPPCEVRGVGRDGADGVPVHRQHHQLEPECALADVDVLGVDQIQQADLRLRRLQEFEPGEVADGLLDDQPAVGWVARPVPERDLVEPDLVERLDALFERRRRSRRDVHDRTAGVRIAIASHLHDQRPVPVGMEFHQRLLVDTVFLCPGFRERDGVGGPAGELNLHTRRPTGWSHKVTYNFPPTFAIGLDSSQFVHSSMVGTERAVAVSTL